MGEDDTAIRIPAYSCIAILGEVATTVDESRRLATSCFDNDTAWATPGFDCATLAVLGYCSVYFCGSCAYAGVCDASCDYCEATPAPSAAECLNFDDEVSAAMGYDCPTLASYCDVYFCSNCSFAGLCDASCGYCTATPTQTTVDGYAVSSSPQLIGNGHDRLFFGEEFVRSFSLRGMLLANGFASDGPGGVVAFADGCGDLVVFDSLFIDNGAFGHGGALHVQGGGTASSSVRIERTRFDSNHCSASGGAVAASDGVVFLLVNLTFSNNIAAVYGGGLYVEYDISLDAYAVEYHNNSAAGGGGMWCWHKSDARIRGGVARGNVAWGSTSAAAGAGAFGFQHETMVEMNDVVVEDNFGGVGGGAIGIAFGCTATLFNITARRNMANSGAGVFFYGGSSLRIAESRLSQSSVSTAGGGVLVMDAEQLVIEVRNGMNLGVDRDLAS